MSSGIKISNAENCKRRHQKIKTEVLTHYGNGKLACVKCGFSDIRALSIDHLNGREISDNALRIKGFKGESASKFYRRLIKEHFPTGYQTLCMNCQWIKRSNGKG